MDHSKHQLHQQLSKKWRPKCMPSSTRLNQKNQRQSKQLFKVSTNFQWKKSQKRQKNRCSQKTLWPHSLTRLMHKKSKSKKWRINSSARTMRDRDHMKCIWCIQKVKIHIRRIFLNKKLKAILQIMKVVKHRLMHRQMKGQVPLQMVEPCLPLKVVPLQMSV
jgi:hypothetical protein